MEGLKPENVNVVDSKGNILSAFIQEEQQEDNPDTPDGSTLTQQAKLTLHQMEVQQSYEKDLEHKITDHAEQGFGRKQPISRFRSPPNWILTKLKMIRKLSSLWWMARVLPDPPKPKKNNTWVMAGFLPPLVGGVPGTDSNIPGYQAWHGREFPILERREPPPITRSTAPSSTMLSRRVAETGVGWSVRG